MLIGRELWLCSSRFWRYYPTYSNNMYERSHKISRCYSWQKVMIKAGFPLREIILWESFIGNVSFVTCQVVWAFYWPTQDSILGRFSGWKCSVGGILNQCNIVFTDYIRMVLRGEQSGNRALRFFPFIILFFKKSATLTHSQLAFILSLDRI